MGYTICCLHQMPMTFGHTTQVPQCVCDNGRIEQNAKTKGQRAGAKFLHRVSKSLPQTQVWKALAPQQCLSRVQGSAQTIQWYNMSSADTLILFVVFFLRQCSKIPPDVWNVSFKMVIHSEHSPDIDWLKRPVCEMIHNAWMDVKPFLSLSCYI